MAREGLRIDGAATRPQGTGNRTRQIGADRLLEPGDAQHAAEMAREVIANQTVLGNGLARMARVLTLSEGLQAAGRIVTLLQSGQRNAAITTLRDKLNDGDLPAADRTRLGALLSGQSCACGKVRGISDNVKLAKLAKLVEG